MSTTDPDIVIAGAEAAGTGISCRFSGRLCRGTGNVPDNPLAVEAWGKPQDINQMVRSFPES
jgi:hypothetical protein